MHGVGACPASQKEGFSPLKQLRGLWVGARGDYLIGEPISQQRPVQTLPLGPTPAPFDNDV